MLNLNFIERTGYNVSIQFEKWSRNKEITAILDWRVLDTCFTQGCLSIFLFCNSILTNNFKTTHITHDICHLVISLANVSSIIVLRCVLNRKLGTVHKMSLDWKLLAWSCPCYQRGRVTKDVTLKHGVPCLVSSYGTPRFGNKFCWYYQKNITTQNVNEVQNARKCKKMQGSINICKYLGEANNSALPIGFSAVQV